MNGKKLLAAEDSAAGAAAEVEVALVEAGAVVEVAVEEEVSVVAAAEALAQDTEVVLQAMVLLASMDHAELKTFSHLKHSPNCAALRVSELVFNQSVIEDREKWTAYVTYNSIGGYNGW